MRKPVTWQHLSSMFGHTYSIALEDQNWKVAENLEEDWLLKNKKIAKGFMFRSPRLSLNELASTIDFLSGMEDQYFLEVWATVPDKAKSDSSSGSTKTPEVKFDAMLHLKSQDDAMMLAFSLTETWIKWSKQEEKDHQKSLKEKPAKLKINKDGSITTTVKVTSIK
jgi:hypothetical protein